MANNIIFMDGFDAYTSVLDKWDSQSVNNTTVGTIVAGAGRGGAGAYLITGANAGPFGASSFLNKLIGTNSSTYLGFALNINQATQNADMALFSFLDASTTQCVLWINSAGVLYITRGGTAGTNVLCTASAPVPNNNYKYVEVKIVFHASAGVAEIRLDQTVVATASSLNTAPSGNAWCNKLTLGFFAQNQQSYNTAYIDDVYVDSLGYNGDNRINGQIANGNGTLNNFLNSAKTWVASTATAVGTTIVDSNGRLQRCIANTGDTQTGGSAPTWATTGGSNTTDNHVTWTCLSSSTTPAQYLYINEPNPDNDSSYIYSNNVGDISRFTFPAITAQSIKTVVVWVYARKDDGGYRAIRGVTKSGGSTGDNGADIPLGGNYSYMMAQIPTDPATGVAWTASGVNAAEFGVKLTA